MFSMLRFFAALFMICHVRGFFRSSTVTKSVRCDLRMAQDVSPARDGGLLKTLLSKGELTSKSPVAGDTVDVSFDVFNAKGEPLYTPEDRSENRFKFVVDGDGEVMYAFHFGVQTMKIGEKASFTVGPRYGLSFLKEVITVVLTLHNITPSPTSKLLDPEVIQEDDEVEIDSAPDARSIFLQQLESGESPLIEEVIQNDATLDGNDPRQRKKSVQYFDPAKHKLDPRRKLKGQGADHSWEENVSTLDICFPLPGDITSKKDIVVCIGQDDIRISKVGGSEIFGGPLHGRILPSTSCWAVEEDDAPNVYQGLRLMITVDKAHGHQELWTTVFNRDFLTKQQKRVPDLGPL